MNTVLLVLGVLGVGAILLAAYVFTVAARNYVSESGHSSRDKTDKEANQRLYIIRSNNDRRNEERKIEFPLTLQSGQIIKQDRRSSLDRRVANG